MSGVSSQFGYPLTPTWGAKAERTQSEGRAKARCVSAVCHRQQRGNCRDKSV